MKIQIWLTGQKIMQIILTAARIPLPRRSAKYRQPVIRRRTIRLRIGPDKPVCFRIAAILAAFNEPRMLIRAMRQHLINHNFQTKLMCLVQQAVEIFQRAKQRINITVIGNIVSEIRHWRFKEWRNPDDVHTQRCHIRQLCCNARQVADAIAVTVGETARINLIDCGFTPPCGSLLCCLLSHIDFLLLGFFMQPALHLQILTMHHPVSRTRPGMQDMQP